MVSISNSFRFREADLNVIGSLHFLLPLFESSFGREYTLGEPCEIYNDSKSSCPELQICYQPIRIRLSLDKTGYWNQLIFQLSHELCHYVLRQYVFFASRYQFKEKHGVATVLFFDPWIL